MPTLTIRNLSPEAHQRLRERAKRNRRSITQEVAHIIETAVEAGESTEQLWDQVEEVRERIRSRYGKFPESSPLIREDRER